MSEIVPSKAGVYAPVCYMVVRSGYEVANAPCACLAANDGHPEDNSLSGPGVYIRAIEDKAKDASSNAVESDFEKMQGTLSKISSQFTSFAEARSRSEDQLPRLKKLCTENASQILGLRKHQSTLEQRIKNQMTLEQQIHQLAEIHKDQLQSLTEAQAKNAEQMQQMLASNTKAVNDLTSRFDDWNLSQAQNPARPTEAEHGVLCTHNVHPPPRKIDKPIVGYDYGTGAGSGRCRVDKAPGVLRC